MFGAVFLQLVAGVCCAFAFDINKGEERFTTQPLNHDSFLSKDIFQQRYFWFPPPVPAASSMIFFYAGNEANVENYVKSCGLMHENQLVFNAALVFAEHRFWGKSLPSKREYQFAGPNQAISDFAVLLKSLLRNETNQFHPTKRVRVIAFGGSYGGMLAAWMRLKHPLLIDAAVASSAPVLAFPNEAFFSKNGGASYWKVVTNVYKACAVGIHEALKEEGALNSPAALDALGLCPDAPTPQSEDVLVWIAYAFNNLAMGDYHFPSDYITGSVLPARPAALACSLFNQNAALGGLHAIRQAIGVLYNSSTVTGCYKEIPNRFSEFYVGLWDQYWCRWSIPQETYFGMMGPPNDMFLPLPVEWPRIEQHCKRDVHVRNMDPTAVHRWFEATSEKEWEEKGSKIIFTNGGHDPWSAGGYYSLRNPTLPTIFIRNGAHHVDLMFTQPNDPPELTVARRDMIEILQQWFQSGEDQE